MNELMWWFGQNTLAALLMIPCVMLACRLFRDRPAVQHLLWLVILLKFITPPVVVWPWSVDELRSMAWAQLSADQKAANAPSPAAPIPERFEPGSIAIEAVMVPKASATSIEQNSMPADDLVVTDNTNEKAQPTTLAKWTPIVAKTAILTWFIGAVVCAVSQLRRLARYAQLVRSGEVAPSHLKVEVTSVASLLRMKAPVSVIVKGIVSPFLWCVGAARLAWPDSLASQADVVRSRGIIAHELAHLRRRDHWVTWLELGASILWWWNPLFWYVRQQLRETAEMSCDALAIAANPESRRDYAELLLRLSTHSTKGVPVPVIAMGASNVAAFEKRLKMVLSSNVSGNLSWRGAAAMAVFAVVTLPYWSLAQSTNREPKPKKDTSAEEMPSSTLQFIAAKPSHVTIASSGTSEIRNDRSVQFNQSDRWQEFTLHFSPADLSSKVSAVQLEILPSDSVSSSDMKSTMLFEVKPHLKQKDGKTIQLEFSKCTFTGDANDDSTANCIDSLSDTGWKVPEFTDEHRVHFLLFHLDRPIETGNVNELAITIDSGGAEQFSALSRVRVSFADANSKSSASEETRWPGTRKTITVNNQSFSFRWCPAGEFLMGSPEDRRSQYGSAFVPQHHVRISRGFWLSEFETTQAQYEMVTGKNPSFWRPFNRSSTGEIEHEHTTNNPVEQVSWDDASSFCQELTNLVSQHRFRLPTEAEWEYACRAGRKECRYGDINDIAWVFENTEIGTEGSFGHRKVGSKAPNAWGLHDMLGNVSEWCSDWSGPPTTQPTVDPTGPTSGEFRIARGGDCFADPGGLRADGRCMAGTRDQDGGAPHDKVRTRGFRIVLVANEQELTFTPGDDQHLPIDLAKKRSVEVEEKTVKPETSQLGSPPAQHREVAIAFNSGTALFDLDTEKKLGPMARGAPADVPQFDLYATWRGPNQSQLHAQVQRLIRVDDAQWGTATSKIIIAALQGQTDADSKALQVLSSAGDPTSTWLVKTKQGGIAILNIEYRKDIHTETNGIVEGFVVRYRLVSTVRELGAEAEPWEISKLYESAFLQNYLQDHELLPKPIVVPPVRGKVLDPVGNPASGVSIVSHTPRQWVDLEATLALKPHNSGSVKKSKQDGTFGLPERKEPYRVLLVHESGVANISHEDLLRANGEVRLQKWASITGTLKLNGKPQADETIVLHFDTLPWSYSRGGPRLTTTHRTTTDNNGNFSFDRVPPLAGMAHQLSRARSLGLGTVFQCESGKTTHIEMDAGNAGSLTVSDNHDHQHDNVTQEIQSTDKPQLPRLIVRTVDSGGRPVPDTGVLFYDRNSHRTGQKQKFEMVSKQTDESGRADLGVMPGSFGCLQLSPSNKELAECYTLISTTMTKCTQAKPSRANVQTEIKNGILTVTFTMTPHVDLEFNIVDEATNEIVFWSEIFYQDPTTNRWWQFGLVDGSQRQHNLIPISPQITRETIRISALGYETKVFRLPDELDRSKPIRRDVRLKPMPDVELRVFLPDGTPAEKAKLTVHYPNELDCLQIQEELSDAQGVMRTKFPPSADIGVFHLEHTGGTAELPMKELLDDVQLNPGTVIRRSIQLKKSQKRR